MAALFFSKRFIFSGRFFITGYLFVERGGCVLGRGIERETESEVGDNFIRYPFPTQGGAFFYISWPSRTKIRLIHGYSLPQTRRLHIYTTGRGRLASYTAPYYHEASFINRLRLQPITIRYMEWVIERCEATQCRKICILWPLINRTELEKH